MVLGLTDSLSVALRRSERTAQYGCRNKISGPLIKSELLVALSKSG